MIALGVVFAVVLGLFASLNTGVRGLLTGRQRSVATAKAKEIIEQARSLPYNELGHDVVGDATLAADANIGGSAPNYTYTPPDGSAETLVGAVSPSYPTHEWTDTLDNTPVTVRVYVTWVSVAATNDQKRLTVEVEHGPAQYDPDVVSNIVRLSTFISVGGQSAVTPGANYPSAKATGTVDAGSGRVRVTGTLFGIDLDYVQADLPVAHADALGEIYRLVHGDATGARSELHVQSGTVSGGDVSGTTASCNQDTLVRASTGTDNDGASALPVQQVVGPQSAASCTVSAENTLGVPLLWATLGAVSDVTSKSTVESCAVCSPLVGTGDGLIHTTNTSSLTASPTVTYLAGLLTGNILQVPSGTATTTAGVDADAAGTDQVVTSTGRIQFPAANVLTLVPGPLGINFSTAVVMVSAVDVSATAQAGPTASSPTLGPTAGAPATVTVDAFQTDALGVGSYKHMVVTPGTAFSDSASAEFVSLSGLSTATVSIDTTVSAGTKSLTCLPSCASIESANASVSDLLVVEVHFVSEEAGVTVADLTITLNYGRLVAEAGYTS
jgi:hypothetical protein